MRAHQILFVEDDCLLSLSACEFIRDRGIRVIEASDAVSATRVIDKHGYISGLVSDIDLGLGGDGFEVARRARAVYPDLPVVFVSGAAAARHALEGVEGSIFISKPYHPRQITDAIAALTVAARAHKAPPAPAVAERQTPSVSGGSGRDMAFRDGLASVGRSWRPGARAERLGAFAPRQAERTAA